MALPLTQKQQLTLEQTAIRLGCNWQDLFDLINFESGWNCQAKNPKSSARGLIQWMDKTAQGMGYASSLDLVTKNPTIESQLAGPVYEYLKVYSPYLTRQSLFLAVFYPVARNWEPTRAFPDSVTSANPGIYTPADYVAFVDARAGKKNDQQLEQGESQVQQAGVGELPAVLLAGFLWTRQGRKPKLLAAAVLVLLAAKRLGR